MELWGLSAVAMNAERLHCYVAPAEERIFENDTRAGRNAVLAREVSRLQDPATMEALQSVCVLGLFGFPVCYTTHGEEAVAVRDSG